MNNEAKNRSFRMPLIEIIIVVAVFVVISVLLLRLYVAADSLQGSAENISRAGILAQSTAEVVKNSDSIDDIVEALKLTKSDNGAYTYTDKGIVIEIEFDEDNMTAGKMLTAQIKAFSDRQDLLCDISVKNYLERQ